MVIDDTWHHSHSGQQYMICGLKQPPGVIYKAFQAWWQLNNSWNNPVNLEQVSWWNSEQRRLLQFCSQNLQFQGYLWWHQQQWKRRKGKNKMLSGSCPASPPNTGGAVGVYVAGWKASVSPEIQIRNVSPEGGKYQIRRGLNWLNSHWQPVPTFEPPPEISSQTFLSISFFGLLTLTGIHPCLIG